MVLCESGAGAMRAISAAPGRCRRRAPFFVDQSPTRSDNGCRPARMIDLVQAPRAAEPAARVGVCRSRKRNAIHYPIAPTRLALAALCPGLLAVVTFR